MPKVICKSGTLQILGKERHAISENLMIGMYGTFIRLPVLA